MIYDSSWEALFTTIKSREYYLDLLKFWDEEYSNFLCFPKKDHIFNAFNLTKQNDVKVVIVGQDPYHEPGQAMGLSFSVPDGIKLPPSLVNIYKELEIEYQTTIDKSSGDLTYLARQGVLMINSILSVRNGEALSHNIKQYSLLFKDILLYLNSLEQPIVFLLWGNHAKKYSKFLNNDKHLILYANHPSPLSANRGGWFNCNHFVKANEFLSANNIQTIDWIKK